MYKSLLLLIILCFFMSSCQQQRYKTNYQTVDLTKLEVFPEMMAETPDLTSPVNSKEQREYVLVSFNNGHYGWFDATVENGEPFNYKERQYGKGNQMMVDEADFPTLARTGLHSDEELIQTKTITGRSVSQITVDGRPWGSSGVGFLAENETIMSVIWADNQAVRKLGLTHPDLARPLFHLWNISKDMEQYNEGKTMEDRMDLEALFYGGLKVHVKITGSRGWQESIFNDEILGTGHIEFWRDLTGDELSFLESHYKNLAQTEFEDLKKRLSYLHTGEMVFFYINRYGFYEGHNEYRLEPLSVALIFGLADIETVHTTSGGDLYNYLISHFTKNPE